MRRIRLVYVLVLLLLAAVLALGTLNHFMPEWWERILYPLDYRQQIGKYSARNQLDPYLVAAVINVESGFDARSTSKAGARGLMQLLPGTGKEMALDLQDSGYATDSLYDPETNIRYGTRYLASLTGKYRSTVFALAAYNGGATNMDKWLKGREDKPDGWVLDRIPFKETREFVRRVLKTRDIYRRLYPESFK